MFCPYKEQTPDLNAAAALQLDGVLFMEGEGEPGEIRHLNRNLRTFGDDASAAGDWLTTAMQSSWDVAVVLLDIDELADLLGERHRIIANNWQGASMMTVAARVLHGAADLLDHVDFAPAALRVDLANGQTSAHRLYSAAEMIDQAADLFSDFAGIVHDNERRWRVFRDACRTTPPRSRLQPTNHDQRGAHRHRCGPNPAVDHVSTGVSGTHRLTTSRKCLVENAQGSGTNAVEGQEVGLAPIGDVFESS